MWFLVPKEAPDDRLHLPVGKELIVGRADGHVVIDDRSVSRKHAILTVKSTKVNGQTDFVVKLRDTSRFGSYVNGDKLLQNERQIYEGDGICFGIPTGIQFNLVRQPLVVCGSTISSSVKLAIQKTLLNLGGELVSDWSERCTLLVISRVSITIKVIEALIQGSCIVTPEYIFHLGDFHTGKRSSPPQAGNYQPVVTQESQHLESADVDLLPRSERRELFKGDIFIFMTKKRYDRLASALELGGARCLLWESDRHFQKDGGEMTVSKAIVFYEETATQFNRRIYSILKKHRRRPIVDAEIGYAVLACSKEDYCNVAKRCDLLSRHGIPSISFSQLPSIMSQSVCDSNSNTNQSRTGKLAISMMDETPITSEAAETLQSVVTETNDLVVKEEVFSEVETKPDVLVPQTPPDAAEEAPDVTNVTTVGCSLEAKVEEPWSEDATLLPECEEDPFDRLPARQKRRKATESASRSSRNTSPRKPMSDDSRRRSIGSEDNEIRGGRQGEEIDNSRRYGEGIDDSGRHGEEEAESAKRCQMDVEDIPRKRKIEDSVTSLKKTKLENDIDFVDEDGDHIPRNCTQVKFASLIRKAVIHPRSTLSDDGPNFKRFRKNALPLPARHRKTPIMVAFSRAEIAAVEESEQAASQSERSTLDSQADQLFEEMRRVAPGRRR